MKLPSAKQIGQLLAMSSLSERQKREVLRNLPFLDSRKIVRLFEALRDLIKEEKKLISQVKTLDLQYQLKMKRVAKVEMNDAELEAMKDRDKQELEELRGNLGSDDLGTL